MGDFFKDEELKEEKQEKIIEDPQQLFATYDTLIGRIETMRNEGYDAILPVRTELVGNKQTPEDNGQIGNIRKMMQISRLAKMDIGKEMWLALKNIEDLDRWSERYIEYSDKYMDALQMLCRSAFKIIANLDKRLKAVEREKQAIHEQAAADFDYGPMRKIKLKDINKPEIDMFATLFDEYRENYARCSKTGDPILIADARKKLLKICSRNQEKIERVEAEMEKIDKKYAKNPVDGDQEK